ncbi:MAG: acyl-CoA dehydrogenase family protein [Cyclobacteriaceae bacterium]|nr:acyl-CoA dehydrogenase family protein [Cyclobacteriaceae bacterium]
MPSYTAPTKDLQFVLHELLQISQSPIPGYADLEADFTSAILEEAAKLAEGALAPLNPVGDQQGCRLENGVVYTPEGFKDAFEQIKQGGWNGLDIPEEFGGQNLPYIMGSGVGEIFVSANMALNMYQGLTHGAISDILAHGSEEQKATYLPKMVAMDWTGPKNLPEPHCGTDLGLMRT